MNDGCELFVGQTADGYLVRLVGRGTMPYSPAVRDFVCGAIEDGAQVVLDLTDCEFLDSTFMGCLVLMSRRGNSGTGGFEIVCGEQLCQQLFGSSHLQKIIGRCDVLPAVEGELVSLPAVSLERKEFGQHLLETHEELAQISGPEQAAFQAVVDRLRQEL